MDTKKMLLITDRADQAAQHRNTCAPVGQWDIVTLHEVKAKSCRPSVILCHTDLRAPDKRKSLDAALRLHNRDQRTPVLFVLPRNDHAMRGEALAFGATETIGEDESPNHLLFALKRLSRRTKRAVQIGEPARKWETIETTARALVTLEKAAARDEALPISALEKGADALLESVQTVAIKDWLDVVRRYDEQTFQHSFLVAGLVASFSFRLGLAPSVRNRLAQAALIHDIGKAKIPRRILSKPGALTAQERALVQRHPGIGHAMLLKQGTFDTEILQVVRHHHEFLDGSGYPDALKGAAIPDLVRLVTICDIFGALLERRPYKPPMQAAEARKILHGMSGKLDPSLLGAFDSIVAECP